MTKSKGKFWPSEYVSFPFYKREMSQVALKRRLAEIQKEYTQRADAIKKLKTTIEESFGVIWDDVSSKKRKRAIVEAKQMFCKVAKDVFKERMSLESIGAEIRQDYDHATVLYGIRTMGNLIETDKRWRAKYEEIIKSL